MTEVLDIAEPRTISFFIKGKPIGQPRPRFNGRHAYNPPGPIDSWKDLIAYGCKSHRPVSPLQGPLRVNLTFFFERPSYHFGRKKKVPYLKSGAPEWHVVTPDRDNLDKAVLDALTRCCFWTDDCQVCAGEIRKKYCDEMPGVSIIIEQL